MIIGIASANKNQRAEELAKYIIQISVVAIIGKQVCELAVLELCYDLFTKNS
jgi:hypothetical protein